MLMKTSNPSPAQIVASVTKTGEHEAIERRLDELKAIRELPSAEMLQIYREGNLDQKAQRIVELDRTIRQIEDERRPLLSRRRELQQEHGCRVAEALAPLRSELASKLLALIDEFELEAQRFEETTAAIERASHVTMEQRVAMPWLAQLRSQLSRLVVATE